MRIGKAKHGGFIGNLAKLGGKSHKLKMAGDMRPEHFSKAASFKKAKVQGHKKV